MDIRLPLNSEGALKPGPALEESVCLHARRSDCPVQDQGFWPASLKVAEEALISLPTYFMHAVLLGIQRYRYRYRYSTVLYRPATGT